MAVVQLEDLDVEFGPERARHSCRETGQKIDAETHIAGLDDRRVPSSCLDLGLIISREPGRADDIDDARLSGEPGESDRGLRRGEIEDAMNLGEDRQRIVGDGDAEGPEPCHLAQIAADRGRALGLDAGGEHAAFRRGNGPGKRLPHAACGAKHSELHLGHGQRTTKRA